MAKDSNGKTLNDLVKSARVNRHGPRFDGSTFSFKDSMEVERVGIPPSEREALAMLTRILSGMNAAAGSNVTLDDTTDRAYSMTIPSVVPQALESLPQHNRSFGPGSYLRAWSMKNVGLDFGKRNPGGFNKRDYTKEFIRE